MFKDKIQKIKEVTDIVSLKDIKAITGEKYITSKSSYTKGMVRLKRGLYSLDENMDSLKVANELVLPSYISLETVLSYYSIIPDAVVSYTSVTTKQTKSFKNDFGAFYYSNVKENLYFGYTYKDGVFIAEKEKALLDYFYLKSKVLKLNTYDYINIEKKKFSTEGCKRANDWLKEERFENLDILNLKILKKYSKKFNKKVYYMTILLINYYKENEKKFTEFL